MCAPWLAMAHRRKARHPVRALQSASHLSSDTRDLRYGRGRCSVPSTSKSCDFRRHGREWSPTRIKQDVWNLAWKLDPAVHGYAALHCVRCKRFSSVKPSRQHRRSTLPTRRSLGARSDALRPSFLASVLSVSSVVKTNLAGWELKYVVFLFTP